MQLTKIKVTKADFHSVDWQGVVDTCQEKECSKYREAYFAKATIAAEKGDKQAESIYLLLGHACSLHLNPDDIEAPLHPFAVFADRRSTIVEDFDDQQIDVLAEIVPEIRDGELLARIA